MENHPIPQDVTGFKFKLIGSVTVKQFLYILGGGILAVVCFILPFSYFIKIPLALFFGGLGAMLAFVPIEGRPMDVMAKNFLKALPAENQYIYRKSGAAALIGEFFSPRITTLQKQTLQQARPTNNLEERRKLLYGALRKSRRPDENEEKALSNINSYLNEAVHAASPTVQNVDLPPTPSSPLSIVTPLPEQHIQSTTNIVMPQPQTLETPIAKPTPQIQDADTKPAFEPKREEIKVETTPRKQTPAQAEEEIKEMQKFEDVSIPKNESPQRQAVNPNESSNVTTIAQDATLKAGFPQLPDVANVVMGIIKDPRGKILPNILVEIMDTNGTPVRAFKTNSLGQFAAATQLPDGEYNVILEDPRKQHEFEQIRIILDGEIFQPLEIISTDQREKLRQELFGGSKQPQVQA